MKPEHAISLDNMFCQPGYLELRKDRISHCNLALPTTPIDTLMTYNGISANKLFAAAGTSIFDATTSTPATDVSGMANAKWQYINFAASGGNFLWACNGANDPRTYDGSAWGTATITGSVAGTDIINVAAHKNRLWFVEVDSSDAHFLAVDSFQGAASAFPLGGVFTRGGYLQAIGTWTRDGGDGVDDLIVFASSRGQLAIYAGTNPGGGGDFALVGVFDTSPPIGRRCFVKVGADLAIITTDGVLPLSRALVTERSANLRISMTQRIQPAIASLARTHADLHGWQLVPYARGTAAFLNVPTGNAISVQYVMNTVTGAWSRYTGWNAGCFETFEDRLFFGGPNGIVYEADRGGIGADSTIVVDMRTAFNYFGRRGQIKQFKSLRSVQVGDGRVTPGFAINVDFRDDAPLAVAGVPFTTQALWDSALWDSAFWPLENQRRMTWQATRALGYCASLRMAFTIQRDAQSGAFWDQFFWDQGYWDGGEVDPIQFQASAFDLIYEPGAIMT
jgi:hypothetical protein